ncbi:MAG: xanthine dehydrogenase family protein molybdopterin-binding subunit [Fervidicoccaceae archaeon]
MNILSKSQFKVIGKPVPPPDLYEKVTGTAQYVFDMDFPGLLHAKLVTSREPHARIKSIDFSKALQLPGVVAVATGKDFPYRLGIYVGDRDILAIDKALWVGHPVAAVVAENKRVAEKAIDLIDVEYDPLPPVFDPEEAIKPDAPILHPDLGKYRISPAFKPVPGTNIANLFKLKKGEGEAALDSADVVIERDFRIPFTSHSYMETWNTIAYYKITGDIEIWTSSQSPYAPRYLTAMSLGIPVGKIKIRIPYVGGGFGGKAGILNEPLVAMLSKKAGYKPVKLSMSRAEQMKSMPIVAGYRAKAKMGFRKDGRIVAYSVRFLFDGGAFADYAVNVARTAGYACTGVYDMPNAYCESITAYTNKVPTTAIRGFGYPENHWVLERMMDIGAKELGLDPLEIRSKNFLRMGDPTSTTGYGTPMRADQGDLPGVMKTSAELIEWDKEPEQPKEPWKIRAKGIAVSLKGPSQPPNAVDAAVIKFNEDASVDVLVATGNYGQGTVNALRMLVAEYFDLPLEKVHLSWMNSTEWNPYTWQTVGSRSLFTVGQALLEAAEDAKKQILDVASKVLKVKPDELEIADGKVFVKGEPWASIPLSEVVMGYTFANGQVYGGPIIGRGKHFPTLSYLDPDTGQALPMNAETGHPEPGHVTVFYTFGSTAVEVELDLLTGEIKVLKATQVYDLGRVINPLTATGQAIGGLVMGMSRALFEEIIFDDTGGVANPNFSFYYIARAKDVPDDIRVKFLETPQANAPFGARGFSENVMIAVIPAIANAIQRATGVEITELPITNERVWKAIRQQRPDLIEKAMKALKEWRG